MMAIAPLMIEHRLIERMIQQIDTHIAKIQQSNKLDLLYIDTAVDFIRSYADRCHHGKEEEMLFKIYSTKPMTDAEKRMVNELATEHSYGRKLTRDLNAARERYARGETAWAVPEAIKALKELVAFYPRHIKREDNELFIPSMKYFTQDEQDKLLADFYEFDRKLIHEKYGKIVESLEG